MSVFSMKIKNEGPREIITVVWDYVFIRVRDEKELRRIRFSNKTRVKAAGGTATLEAIPKELPPTNPDVRVVTIKELENREDNRDRMQAEIKCVLYADGTWWRQPLSSRGLREAEPSLESASTLTFGGKTVLDGVAVDWVKEKGGGP